MIASEYSGGLQRYADTAEAVRGTDLPDISSPKNFQLSKQNVSKAKRPVSGRTETPSIPDTNYAASGVEYATSTASTSSCCPEPVYARSYSALPSTKLQSGNLLQPALCSERISYELPLQSYGSDETFILQYKTRSPSAAEDGQQNQSCSLHSAYPSPEYAGLRQYEARNCQFRHLSTSREEVGFIGAFIDNVAVWMDVLAPGDSFSQEVPGYALNCPALLNALLACGARSLSAEQPQLGSKAEWFHKRATVLLSHWSPDSSRNSRGCTAASVLLCVYELMTSREPIHFMKHVAKSRSLVQRQGWQGQNTGISGACFWIIISLETFSCLRLNWETTWKPEDWGIYLDWSGGSQLERGEAQIWVHRALYMIAKAADFKARAKPSLPSDPHQDQAKLGLRLAEWQSLKQLCDDWNDMCPRSMKPVAYMGLEQSDSQSTFPTLW